MPARVKLVGPYSRFGLLVAIIVLALDQGHKWWMLNVVEITLRHVITVTPFFDLVLRWNNGVSYGLFPQDTRLGLYILVAFTAVAVACMVLWLAACDGRRVALALGLVIGGALGNGADRLAHGAVADFFSFHAFGYYWYVFNLADVAIVAGVGILLYDSIIDRRRTSRADGTGK